LSSEITRKYFNFVYCNVNPFLYSLFIVLLSELFWQCIIWNTADLSYHSQFTVFYIHPKFPFHLFNLTVILCFYFWEFSEILTLNFGFLNWLVHLLFIYKTYSESFSCTKKFCYPIQLMISLYILVLISCSILTKKDNDNRRPMRSSEQNLFIWLN
jgi:hypothetical protein